MLGSLVADRLADDLLLFCAQTASAAGFLASNAGFELARTTLAVQAYDLLAAFMQHFSRLLAGIFFLHELLIPSIFKNLFINRAGSVVAVMDLASRRIMG